MESTYKVIELIGSSPESWEDAAKNALDKASQSLEDIRIAEVVEMDVKVMNGKITNYRTKMGISFKYQE